MEHAKFRRLIRKELEILSPEQQVKFAWQAAVLALPFIGIEGNFNYLG